MSAIRVAMPGLPAATYDVHVGRGVASGLPALLRRHCAAHGYAVIADHRVAELHGAALMASLAAADLPARLFTFPAGEWNKTREQWGALGDQLLASGIGRDGAIVAFGGGVAGDLAGFVAATYLRGIPYVQVPTTLLAMIDSSVGGKTGVDLPAGKNLVGAFHQPRLVLAEIGYLATLPRIQIAAGMAEAIKHGVIRDAAYFASLEDAQPILARDLERLEAVVHRSVEIKAAVVADDEREAGLRAILNFGHTVGHAVELLSGFDLLHGEAVAIGMVAEARLAEALGVASEVRAPLVAMLARYGLPTAMPDSLATDRVLGAMQSDKKSRAGRIRFALPAAVGAMSRGGDGAWTVDADPRVIRQALDSSR